MAPLIAMLIKGDLQLKEMAAFALGRLAQNVDNQAGVVEVLTRYLHIRLNIALNVTKRGSCDRWQLVKMQ
jgi:hypothetical protein